MNEQPTPETDALMAGCGASECRCDALTDFARRLERERNTEQERVEIGKHALNLVQCALKEVQQERDQLRKVCDELAEALSIANNR